MFVGEVCHCDIRLCVVLIAVITPHRTGDEPVNDVLKDILDFIKSNPGIKKPAIIAHIGKSKATLTRYLKQLVEQDLIEYKGSDKTGGYYPKE